jgi:hypothetical protein
VDFVSDRMLCVSLRGRWCDITLNVQVPGDDESDDSKDGFCEEFTAAVRSLPLLSYENVVRS